MMIIHSDLSPVITILIIIVIIIITLLLFSSLSLSLLVLLCIVITMFMFMFLFNVILIYSADDKDDGADGGGCCRHLCSASHF